MEVFIWFVAFAASIAALVQAYLFYRWMMTCDEGNEEMRAIATAVRDGANAYLRQQYVVVTIVFVVIAILLGLAAFFGLQSKFVPIAFLTGGFFSGLSGWLGMKTATQASARTAAAAKHSLNQGLRVAFRSGAVMGLTVVGLGLFYITIWFAILYWLWPSFTGNRLSLEAISVAMLCFGMGASAQALFARVGGGIFTKAADVGADLVGKVEQSMSEDSPRNPATIADNVGDNVGDVAGMGADLYESYCGSILATASLGVAAFANPYLIPGLSPDERIANQLNAIFLPLVLAAVGIVLSIAGIYLVRTAEDATQKNLLAALGRGINFSAIAVSVATLGLTWWLMPKVPEAMLGPIPGVAISVIVGLAAGWLIGKYTEYATSDEFSPTRKLADQAKTGPATIIIGGIADGMGSVWAPVIVICFATLLSFGFACGWMLNEPQFFALGLYGVGIAAVGMLSTLGITLATDAYGPIADNAGGNAEMAGLEPEVRARTDALDSLGNTTAATGKGFAIGSAALTALALLAAYVEQVRISFDMWGNEVITESYEDGIYKLSPGFVVAKQGEQKDFFLVLPYLLNQDPDLRQQWRELDFSQGPVSAPETILTTRQGELGTIASFTPTGGRLTNLRLATLIDFTSYYTASVMNPRVLIGIFIGAMTTFVFCALTMKAVGRAAQAMVVEVRRQLAESPGILTGETKPDYQSPVAISTKAAQREMAIPSILGLATPIVTGLVLGVAGVLGLLVGSLSTGFCLAIFMSNSGGSWDNAKKYIESGQLGGKGSSAHKAAVVGDTVGDPFKDTSGPSLNILIKLMSIVSVVAASLIVRYSAIAMGWL